MTITTKETYFANRAHEVTLDNLVLASKGEDGLVHFHRRGGGFLVKLTPDAFAEKYVEVAAEELEEILKKFKPIDFCLGDDDGTIRGYTNGELWNGWQMSYLSKDTIFDATAEGGFLAVRGMNRVARFIHLPETNDIFEISNWHGGELDGPVDIDKVREIAASGLNADMAADEFQKIGLFVLVVPKVNIVEEGADKPTTFYRVGDGWTWEAGPEEPTEAAMPSRGPRM